MNSTGGLTARLTSRLHWRGSTYQKKDGPKVGLEVYAFLTTTPNKLVGTINHERMPVILLGRCGWYKKA
jgi:putative SOS response-associated peptidase YedK